MNVPYARQPPPPGGHPWPTEWGDAVEGYPCNHCPPWDLHSWGVCWGGPATPRAPWAGCNVPAFKVYMKRGLVPSCLVCGESRIHPVGGALGCLCGLRGGPWVGGLEGGQEGA